MPPFHATHVDEVSGGVVDAVDAVDAVDQSGSPTRWSFTGDVAIVTTPVTTNEVVFTGGSNGNRPCLSHTATTLWILHRRWILHTLWILHTGPCTHRRRSRLRGQHHEAGN
jgi:hypothetical protein